jgi:hypothetical protein
MRNALCLLTLLATIAVAGAADAAVFKFILLGSDNRPLEHGQATVIAKSPEHGWTRYVGFYRQQKYYAADLPNVDYLNIIIYMTADTSQKSIEGLYGHRDHTMYLRTDRVGYAMCSRGVTEWGMPWDLLNLVDDLDAAFPGGVPGQMTNIRAQLQNAVLPALNNTPDPPDPDLARQKQEFRRRVMRHLQ